MQSDATLGGLEDADILQLAQRLLGPALGCRAGVPGGGEQTGEEPASSSPAGILVEA